MEIKELKKSVLDAVYYHCADVDFPAMKREVADELDRFFGDNEWFVDFDGKTLREGLRSTADYYCKEAWPDIEILLDRFFGELRSRLVTLCKDTIGN